MNRYREATPTSPGTSGIGLARSSWTPLPSGAVNAANRIGLDETADWSSSAASTAATLPTRPSNDTGTGPRFKTALC
jgi:hypothetical protein